MSDLTAENVIASRPKPQPKKIKPTTEDITRAAFLEFQRKDPQNLPIVEVLNTSASYQGHVQYRSIGIAADANSLVPVRKKDQETGTINTIAGAYAEAAILQNLRAGTRLGSAIYEPARQPEAVIAALDPSSVGAAGIAARPAISRLILDSFANKTPDILYYVPRIEVGPPNRREVSYGSLVNIVDPNNPTNIASLTARDYRDQNLIAPMEVTISGIPKIIRAKIAKFKENYTNPFQGDFRNAYVPVLVLDFHAFQNLSDDHRREFVGDMRRIGGLISLQRGLTNLARTKALDASQKLTDIMNARRVKDLSSQDPSQQIEEPISSSENSVSATPSIQNRSVQDSNEPAGILYRRYVAAAQKLSDQFLVHKLDIKNNSDHLNIAVAITAISHGKNTRGLLRQSPTYKSLTSTQGENWIDNIIRTSQTKLNQSEPASAPTTFSENSNSAKFQIIDAAVQSQMRQSNFSDNTLQDLDRRHAMIAAVAIASSQDPKEILSQSPFCQNLSPEATNALVDKWIGMAQTITEPKIASSHNSERQL
jgi:hypothetical protein